MEANPKNTKLAKRLDEMMTKPEDYVVKFFDTMGEAERYAAEEGPKYKSAVASTHTRINGIHIRAKRERARERERKRTSERG